MEEDFIDWHLKFSGHEMCYNLVVVGATAMRRLSTQEKTCFFKLPHVVVTRSLDFTTWLNSKFFLILEIPRTAS